MDRSARRPRWQRRIRPATTFGAVALAMVLTACGSGDDAGFGDAGVAESAPDVASDADVAMEDEAGAAPREAPAPVAADAVDDRQVIRSAYLVLEVADGAAVANEIEATVDAAGGFLSAAELRRDTDGIVSGTMRLRVPSEELLDTVDAIDALGEAVPVRRIDEQDVTTELTDIEARLTNLRAYEDELRDLLGEVRGEDDTETSRLLAVFEQLNQVRLDIETIEARQSMLVDRVSLSTIDVELRPTRSSQPVVDTRWEPAQTVRDAVASLLRGLATVVDGLIWLVVTVLPILLVFAVLLAIPVLLLRALIRWQRARRPASPTPPPPAPTAVPTDLPPTAVPADLSPPSGSPLDDTGEAAGEDTGGQQDRPSS